MIGLGSDKKDDNVSKINEFPRIVHTTQPENCEDEEGRGWKKYTIEAYKYQTNIFDANRLRNSKIINATLSAMWLFLQIWKTQQGNVLGLLRQKSTTTIWRQVAWPKRGALSDTCGKEALKIVWNMVKASRMVTSDDDDAGQDEDDNDDDKMGT